MKILKLALAAMFLVTLAATADAGVISLNRLKFNVGAGSKDTTSSGGMTTGTTRIASEDTTTWMSLGSYSLETVGVSGYPQVSLQVSSTVAADSTGIIVQWSSDPRDQAKLTTASTVYGTGTFITDILTTASTAFGSYFRVIVWANDTGGVAKTYSVIPIIHVK